MDTKNPKPPVTVGRIRSIALTPSLLLDKLTARLGEARASVMVADALERGLRPEVPEHLDDLLTFTNTHVMDDLVAALGESEVPTFLEELADAARLSSGVRSSMRTEEESRGVIALIDHDVFRRASTARQLISRRMHVLAIHELDELLNEASRPGVIVMDLEDALKSSLFRVLSLPEFDPAIVLRATDEGAGRHALEHAGVEVFEITGSKSPAEIASAVERVLTRKCGQVRSEP